MNDQVKKQIIAQAAPALGVPLLRAAVSHHYTMKQMERREEMELKMAERQQKGVQELARAKGGSAAAPATAGPTQRVEPVSGGAQQPSGGQGDVYDELTALKSQTDCGFCHSVIDSLMDAPPSEARQGLDELRSYVRETERIEGQGVSEEQAREIVGELVDRWEIVPRHVANAP